MDLTCFQARFLEVRFQVGWGGGGRKIIVKLFWRFFSFVKFSYWSKFRVNIITGSGVTIISFIDFFHQGLTRNPEIGNTLVWVLLNMWRLGRFRETGFGTDVFNEMLLNAAKCQGYSFYSVWVIKGNKPGGTTHPNAD